jgi:hypothetical protein
VYLQPVEGQASPADFVRASMSVPVFFQPLTIPYLDSQGVERGKVLNGGQNNSQKWEDRHDVRGKIPQRAVFCDGEGAPAMGSAFCHSLPNCADEQLVAVCSCTYVALSTPLNGEVRP